MLPVSDLQFQIITFVLEFAGLSLALIEVRAPATAARIARFLGELASPIEDLRRYKDLGDKAHEKLSSSLGKLLNTVLTLGTIPIMAIFAWRAVEAAMAGSITAGWLAQQAVELVFVLIVVTLGLLLQCLLLYFVVVGGSDFTTRFVEGRAVGTLGILLATVGFLMEFYQLMTAI